MENIIIIMCVVLAVATVQALSLSQQRGSFHTDKYIEMNRQQHTKMLNYYDARMEKFQKDYIKHVSATNEDLNLARECINAASRQVDSLRLDLVNIKDSLENYYTNYFDTEIEDCGTKFDVTTRHYVSCVIETSLTTNEFSIGNRKAFETAMQAAECTMKVYYNSTWDCILAFNKA